MKNLLQKLIICAVALLATFACSSPNSSPSAVVTAVNKAMQLGDYEGVVSFIYLDEENMKIGSKEMSADEFRASLASMIEDKAGSSIKKKKGIASFEIVNEEISEDGESAVVTVHTVYGDGTEDDSKTEVVKRDGKWYMSLEK